MYNNTIFEGCTFLYFLTLTPISDLKSIKKMQVFFFFFGGGVVNLIPKIQHKNTSHKSQLKIQHKKHLKTLAT